ncbi:MAG: aryl-sulfate sulfotransferase [Collinsella sp.]
MATTGCYRCCCTTTTLARPSYPKFDQPAGRRGGDRLQQGHVHSFGRIFTVDEAARTYELEDQIAVPFSGYVSSAQRVGDSNSMLVASGQAKTFTEYDRCGLAITTHEMEAEKYIYRVYKYEL